MEKVANALPKPPPRDRLVAAYLFTQGSDANRTQLLAEWVAHLAIKPVDQVVLSVEGKIGIDEIRLFQHQMQLTPVDGSIRLGVIPDAHRLTLEASNALLKLLEDPPRHGLFLLFAPKEDQVLPTIISRCQRWRIGNQSAANEPADTELVVEKLVQLSLRERFALAESWAKDEDFRGRFDQLIVSARELFLREALAPETMEQLLYYRGLAETNTVPRLLAEVTLLGLDHPDQWWVQKIEREGE